ncbi:MAG TPA: HD domain-containing protein [Clostridia bacterium]|nr:HD domain-containing protein [Clostridia bacterium]
MDLDRLGKQMQFIIEIDKVKLVMRQNYLTGGSRRENDSEHSWHLAMMIVILSEYFKNADALKTVKMALIHDLVEIYAGDTFAYDEQGYQDKDERERAAADRIFTLLPEDQATEYRGLWEEFERMDTEEAIFAAAVDRIQPLLMNSEAKGKMWKQHKVTKEMAMKRNKMVFEDAPELIADFVRKRIEDAASKHYFYEDGYGE